MDSKKILGKAREYRDYSAQNLSKIIQVPAFSTTEKDRIALLKKLCEEAGMEDLWIDGLGSLLGRVGSGSRKIVFDAHIDTVGVGDESQWKTPPFSGLIQDGLVHGAARPTSLAAPPLITRPHPQGPRLKG